MKSSKLIKTGVFASVVVVAVTTLGGIDRGGIAFGTLSWSEWMVVGNTEFDTAEAAIYANGTPVSQNALREGQVLTVDGRLESSSDVGVADIITYDDNVIGPISWIDYYADEGLFVALGQLIRVNSDTAFSGNFTSTSIYGLSTGMSVEVSGLRLAEDEVLATYIELKPENTQLQVSGYVKNVDTSSRTFQINDLTITYQLNAIMNGFMDGHPVDRQLVEVRGHDVNGDDELIASFLRRKPILEGEPGTQILLDGLVTNFVTSDEVFRVAGTPLYLASDVQIIGGNSTGIENNVRVVVDGHFDDDGVVNVSELRFYYTHGENEDDDQGEEDDDDGDTNNQDAEIRVTPVMKRVINP